MNTVKQIIKNITLEDALMRFFTAFFFGCSITFFTNSANGKDRLAFDAIEFFQRVSLTTHVIIIGCLFIILNLLFTYWVNKKWIERLLLFFSYFVYAIQCVSTGTDMLFAFGAVLILFAICKYCFSFDFNLPFPKYAMIAVVVICGGFFATFVGIQTSCRVLTQSTPCFDFGIFSQMYYYMKETLTPMTTCERSVLLSHFDIHVSPIYYLFLPIYAIFPYPVTLQICQALLLASGLIPLILICRKLSLSYKACAAFAVCYAFYPSIAGGCYYDLHENKFLLPLILWLFYFIEKNKWWGIITFATLTLLVKEDAPVYVAFIAVYLLIAKKDIVKGCVLLSLSLVYFAGVISYLESYGYSGIMSYRYNNFIYEENGGLISVIKAVLISPAKVISESFEIEKDVSASKIVFMLQTLAPLCFLPFITKKYTRFILLGPYVLVNLMPDYVYQHSIYFQYTYGAVACLFYLSILNFSELSSSFKRTVGVCAAASSMIFFSGTVAQKPNYLENYQASYENHNYVSDVLASIPEDASVAANTMYVTGLSQRKVVYSMDDNNYANNPIHTEYIVLDLRYSSNRKLYQSKYQNSSEYTLLEYRENWIAVLRCNKCITGDCNG